MIWIVSFWMKVHSSSLFLHHLCEWEREGERLLWDYLWYQIDIRAVINQRQFFFFQRLRKEQVCFQTIIFYGVIMANNYNMIWLDSLLDRKFDCNYWEIWYPLTWRLTIFGVLLNREFKKESMQPSKKRSMVLWKIYQGVDYSVFEKIANAKTAKETWSI